MTYKNEFLILKCKPCIRIGEEADLKSVALNGVLGSNPRHGAYIKYRYLIIKEVDIGIKTGTKVGTKSCYISVNPTSRENLDA